MKIKHIFLASWFAISSIGSLSAQAQAIEWPEPAASVVSGGTFPAPDRLRTFGPGMTHQQVIANIGTQHFLDNPNKPNVWNYLLNFRTKPNPSEHITCQFQIIFQGGLTAGYAWKPSSCASAIQGGQAAANEKGIDGTGLGTPKDCLRCKAPPAPAPIVAAPVEHPPVAQVETVYVEMDPVPEPEPEPQKIELAGDALFKFGGGDFEHLLPGGKEELERISKELVGVSLIKLEVHGFTDTLGNDSVNMPLSQRRANTVKTYLAANGVHASLMTAEGHGAREPVKVCSGPRAARIVCEAPNRRVLIKAFGVAGKP